MDEQLNSGVNPQQPKFIIGWQPQKSVNTISSSIDPNKYITIDKQREIKSLADQKWDDFRKILDNYRTKWYTLEWFAESQRQTVKNQINQPQENLRTQASQKWSFWGTAEVLMNPIWAWFEAIDEAIQKIPVYKSADNSWIKDFAVNLVPSVLKMASSTTRAVTNPFDTLSWLTQLVWTDEWREWLKNYFVDRYWSLEWLSNYARQDPAWIASDLLTVVSWWASLVWKSTWLAWKWASIAWKLGTAKNLADVAWDLWRIATKADNLSSLWLNPVIQKWIGKVWVAWQNLIDQWWIQNKISGNVLKYWANAVLDPLKNVTGLWKTVWNVAWSVWQKFQSSVWEKWIDFSDRALSSLFGLDAQTVRTMKKNPELLSKIDKWEITSDILKEDLLSTVEWIGASKKNIWSVYSSVYENPTRFQASDIANDIITNLKSEWVKIEWDKIVWFDTTKMTGLTPEAKTALKSKFKDVLATLRDKQDLSVEELHNMRKDLYWTAYKDWFANKKAPWVAKVSDILNERLKAIPWFSKADEWFKEASDLLTEIKTAVQNKQWDFKWTLNSLLWERWNKRLEILEKYYPWLRDKIETLSAYSDYSNTRNIKKVWLYEKAWAWIVGWVVWGIPWFLLWIGSAVARDFITDPKWLKNYIVNKWEKTLASKIETNKPLTINEKKIIWDILEEVKANPKLALPYKPSTIAITPEWVVKENIISTPKSTVRSIIEKPQRQIIDLKTVDKKVKSTAKPKPIIDTKALKKDISSKPIKELEPLYKEAKKYKSAEEFIDKQKYQYHWTTSNFDEFKSEYIWKNTDPWIIGKWFYFTNNKKFADGYAKWEKWKIIDAYISTDNVFDLEKIKTQKQASDMFSMDEKDFYRTRDWKIVPKDFKSADKFWKKVKDMWYDWVSFERYPWSIETMIFDPKNIKTKSQLKQIREEANKK